jgi:hypothetical protein
MLERNDTLRESFHKGEAYAEIHSTKDAIARAFQLGIPVVVAWNLPIAWYWRIGAFLGMMFVVGIVVASFRARHGRRSQSLAQDAYLTPAVFQQLYLRVPRDNNSERGAEEVDLLTRAGIGVGIYERHPAPPIFWRKAAAAANQLHLWLEQNPTATPEDRLAHARKVVDINRLVHRSLRAG